MTQDKKDPKTSVSIAIAVIPALIAALAGIIGSYFSYSAGVDAVRIPLRATQTASAMQITNKGGSINSDVAIAIDSQRPWQSTGLDVNAGEIISVNVVGGKWSGWRDSRTGEFMWPENDGTGFAPYVDCGSDRGLGFVGECPVKQANVNALVGRIGSAKYAIGNSCTFEAESNGILELSINDSSKVDNFGVLAIIIKKINSPNPAIDNNCGFRIQ